MDRYCEFNADFPQQVAFYDWEIHEWVGGIGFDTLILRGDDGTYVEIADVYANAPEDIEEPIRAYMDWVDISDNILGDDPEDN